MKGRHAANVIEAAYRWEADERAWVAGIVEAARPFGVGAGAVGYTIDLVRRPSIASLVADGEEADRVAPALASITKAFGRPLARAMFAPTELAGNAAYRFERVVNALGTTRGAVEKRAGCTLPAMWAVVGGNPDRRSLALAFPSRTPIRPDDAYPNRDRARQLGLLGAHLGAALRLRSSIAPSANDPETEAVFSPGGKLLHATGAAKARRGALAAATARAERARLRRTSDAEALALWRALVDGRWTIIDVEEVDGKRLVLARRNPIGTRDVSALDDEERDVAWLASMGHSHKYIAYELGFSVPSVVRRLTSALAKLGFESRRDLVRFFGET